MSQALSNPVKQGPQGRPPRLGRHSDSNADPLFPDKTAAKFESMAAPSPGIL